MTITANPPTTEMQTTTAKTATRKIKSGTACVVGKMSTGHIYPEGDEYWIVNDNANMQTLHVLVADAPNLDKI